MALNSDSPNVSLPLSGTPGQDLAQLQSYTASVTFSASNTVNVFAIPATVGSNISIHEVSVEFANLGANTAIEVGDTGSATRFITSTATTSAGSVKLNTLNRGYTYTSADNVVVTNSGSAAISGQIVVRVVYQITYPN